MKYTIEGIPQQQERPRATAKIIYVKGKPKAIIKLYDPPKSKAAKKDIAHQLQTQNPILTEAPLQVVFRFYIPIPKSYTKKVRRAIADGTYFATKKPDLSNYIKLIEDAANGILWKDDSQIVTLIAHKEYSEEPRTEIEIEIL